MRRILLVVVLFGLLGFSAEAAPGPWEMPAAQLAEQRVTTADLEELREFLDENAICVSLQYFARFVRSARAASRRV